LSRVRTLVATEILLVLGLLGFLGLVHAIEVVWVGDITITGFPALLIPLVPAILWLSYFHNQDRHEPRPKLFVFGVFLIGAFVAGPAAEILIQLVTRERAIPSLRSISAEQLLAAVLTVGLAQELCKYLVVRYTIYQSSEFDEPLDGILYMTAAGIGFATHQNIRYVWSSQEVLVTAASGHAVVTTLGHACFASVLGFALGRAKFFCNRPRERSLTLLGGLLVAATLNGHFAVITETMRQSGVEVHRWRSVTFAAVFAAVIFFITSLFMRRLLARPSPSESES